ncbi:MAG: glycosyltransferase family 4 protein [Propylenella sp.]
MNKRILFFLTQMVMGGAERQSIQLAKKLNDRGWDCRFLSFFADYSHHLVDEDTAARTTFVGGRRLRDVKSWRACWAAIGRFDPKVVVGVNQAPLRLSVWGRASGQHSAKTICTFHSTIIDDRRARRRFPLFRWTLPFADCLVYVSHEQRKYWERRGLWCRRRTVIHNGVDVQSFRPPPDCETKIAAKRKLGLAGDDFVVGLVGAFRPEKNHNQLIDAVAVLRRRGMPAKAMLVGGGALRAAIETHAATMGVGNHVIVAGEQRDVRPFIAAFDVGVLCSVAIETFSMAALEIMAMGVPMVMSNIGGASEMVADGTTGYLFPPRDTDALIGRLMILADTESRLRIGQAARDNTAHQFTSDLMASRYEALLDTL